MKWIIRSFFKTLRLFLGPVILLVNWITTPRPVERSSDSQRLLDAKTKNMALYQFKTCPFCIKVRRTIHSQSLKIEIRDARYNPQNRADLLAGGGEIKVPCLRVSDDTGQSQWIYESSVIIDYLNNLSAESAEVTTS